jgi:hypothetical protein
MPELHELTIKTNYWLVPSVSTTFAGWLEGDPTPVERDAAIQQTLKKRINWKPSKEAWELLETLKGFIGFRVRISYWVSDMWLDGDEAPAPIEANCTGLLTSEEDGFVQPFLQVDTVTEVKLQNPFSSSSFLRLSLLGETLLAPVSGLYQVCKIGNIK